MIKKPQITGMLLLALVLMPGLSMSDSMRGETTIPEGKYKCEFEKHGKDNGESRNLQISIKSNSISSFSSYWGIWSRSPDLRPGYAPSCHYDLSSFKQKSHGSYILLMTDNDSRIEDECSIKIWSEGPNIRIQSSMCKHVCLDIDATINQKTKKCVF